MISDEEPEPGPSNHHVLYSTPTLGATFASSRKRKRTDVATTSPRGPKRRVAAGSDSSATEEETDSELEIATQAGDRFSDSESNDEILHIVQPFPPFKPRPAVDDDHPLQYIDVPPSASTSPSTPSLPFDSLPQSPSPAMPDPDVLPSTSGPVASSSQPRQPCPTPHTPDLLSEYTCPICFSQPSDAALTPCGHICCGTCLFTAVKTTLHRGAMGFSREPNIARCPVCRAPIPGWDGRGGGVIGLKVRVVISL